MGVLFKNIGLEIPIGSEDVALIGVLVRSVAESSEGLESGNQTSEACSFAHSAPGHTLVMYNTVAADFLKQIKEDGGLEDAGVGRSGVRRVFDEPRASVVDGALHQVDVTQEDLGAFVTG